jgi:(p)ppGpp synthase/HD superfamily hydrolase
MTPYNNLSFTAQERLSFVRKDPVMQDAAPDALMTAAQAWAEQAHAGQVRRDGATYLAHVTAVAGNLRALGVTDPELLAAALLHDLVESTPATVAEVEAHFGPRVAGLVEAVTKLPGESGAEAAARAAAAGEAALLLRLADRLDGVRRSRGRAEPNRTAFLATSRAVHLPLAEAHFTELGRKFREALDEAEER